MTLEEEIGELRAIVAAQSRLLTNLLAFHREADPIEKPALLSDDEIDEMMETVCDGLPPHLVRSHFPLAPRFLKEG